LAAEELFERDLRILRRWIAALLALLLLPWLFLGASVSFPRWPRPQPVRLPQPVPVPDAFPVAVRYVPVPLPALEEWIQRHYPGTLVTLDDLRAIDQAARAWDVSLPLLLGILGAEQSFLNQGGPDGRNAAGLLHALTFRQNPFDYGVYPGSTAPFAIGVYASAYGAASIVARVIESFPARAWTQAEYQAFFRALSGYYVHGDVAAADAEWLANTARIAAALWGAAASHPAEWAAALAGLGLAGLKSLGQSLAAQASALATAAGGKLAALRDWAQRNAAAFLEQQGVPAAVAVTLAAGLALFGELLPALAGV
jgi:hypothetical protein